MEPVFVYILRCADGSFYCGTTRKSLEARVHEHNGGALAGYTATRRPVELVWHETFQRAEDAIAMERRIKGWSRRKKIALIEGDWDGLKRAATRMAKRASSSSCRHARSKDCWASSGTVSDTGIARRWRDARAMLRASGQRAIGRPPARRIRESP